VNLSDKHRFLIKALVFYGLDEFVLSSSGFWLRNVNSHLHINSLSCIQENTEFGLAVYLGMAERFRDVVFNKSLIPYIIISVS